MRNPDARRGLRIGYRRGVLDAWRLVDKTAIFYPMQINGETADFARKRLHWIAGEIDKLRKKQPAPPTEAAGRA